MARVYHHRVRDGVPVVWAEDGAWIKCLAPPERPVPPERVAEEVLADAIGRAEARPLVPAFLAWLGGLGPAWDLTERAIRVWSWRAGRRA